MPNFKEIEQDLTELNGEGNRERGRNGEELPWSYEEKRDRRKEAEKDYMEIVLPLEIAPTVIGICVE